MLTNEVGTWYNSIKGVDTMYETMDVDNMKGNNFNDLTGERFNRLTVLGLSTRRSGRKTYWVCKCNCGNNKVVRSDSLKDGSVKSCGCLKEEQDALNLTANHSHLESRTVLHNRWLSMKARCFNVSNSRYSRYGGRGITMHKQWVDSYESFRDWALDNGFDKSLTIERIDNDGNYGPDNCTWIPMKEQANNRSTNVNIEYLGRTQNMKQWTDELGLKYGTINARYHRGWKVPKLFSK